MSITQTTPEEKAKAAAQAALASLDPNGILFAQFRAVYIQGRNDLWQELLDLQAAARKQGAPFIVTPPGGITGS